MFFVDWTNFDSFQNNMFQLGFSLTLVSAKKKLCNLKIEVLHALDMIWMARNRFDWCWVTPSFCTERNHRISLWIPKIKVVESFKKCPNFPKNYTPKHILKFTNYFLGVCYYSIKTQSRRFIPCFGIIHSRILSYTRDRNKF